MWHYVEKKREVKDREEGSEWEKTREMKGRREDSRDKGRKGDSGHHLQSTGDER